MIMTSTALQVAALAQNGLLQRWPPGLKKLSGVACVLLPLDYRVRGCRVVVLPTKVQMVSGHGIRLTAVTFDQRRVGL